MSSHPGSVRATVVVDVDPDTAFEVRFEPHGTQTRVTLEHRGLERLSPEDGLSVVQYGWRRLAFQFEEYVKQRQEEL
jgi:hypothetical protein